MLQTTLAIIKPDAVARGLAGEILAAVEAEGLRLQRNAAPASAHSPALTPRTRAPLESLYGPYVKRLRSDAVACYRWAPHPAQAEPVLRAAGQSSSTPRMVPTAGKRRC